MPANELVFGFIVVVVVVVLLFRKGCHSRRRGGECTEKYCLMTTAGLLLLIVLMGFGHSSTRIGRKQGILTAGQLKKPSTTGNSGKHTSSHCSSSKLFLLSSKYMSGISAACSLFWNKIAKIAVCPSGYAEIKQEQRTQRSTRRSNTGSAFNTVPCPSSTEYAGPAHSPLTKSENYLQNGLSHQEQIAHAVLHFFILASCRFGIAWCEGLDTQHKIAGFTFSPPLHSK